MKKSLIALAALAAVGVASAQSSVTIYGTLDASAGQLKRTISETGSPSTTQTVSSMGGLNSSRGTNLMGFRGTEDLGGGLTASFTYEMSLNGNNVANNGQIGVVTATGATSAVVGNGSPFAQTRQAWIGLGSKTMGEVRIGSQNTLMVPIGGYSVAIQEVGLGGSTIGQLNGLATTRNPIQLFTIERYTFVTPGVSGDANSPLIAAVGSQYLTPNMGVSGTQPRYSNVLTYISPTMSGFRASLQLVRENSENGAGVGDINGAVSKVKAQILGLEYDQGPLSVKALYTNKSQLAGRTANVNTTNGGNGLAANAITAANAVDKNSVSHLVLAGSYNLGVAIPFAIYSKGDNKFEIENGAAGTTKVATDMYELGLRIPMGALAPYVSVSRGDWKATEAGVADFNVKMSTYQVGTTYAMSKRTTLYAATGQSKFTASQAGVAGEAQDKLRGFRLGVTHAF